MAITFGSWLLTRDVRFASGGKTTEFDGGMLATATVLLSLRLAQWMFIPVLARYERVSTFLPAHRLELVAFAQNLLERHQLTVLRDGGIWWCVLMVDELAWMFNSRTSR